MNPFLVLVRAIHFGVTLWLFGEFVFFFAVVGPAVRRVSPDATDNLRGYRRRLLWVAGFCVTVGIASAIVWLLLEAAGMSGMPFALAMNWATIETVIGDTLFGRIWVCRIAVSLMLIAVLWCARRREPHRHDGLLITIGALLAGAYAATLAWTGHAAADTGVDHYAHLGADAIHLLAAGAWVGALPALVSLLSRAGGGGDRHTLAALAAQRFSTVGLLAVSALVFTGLVNAAYLVGSVAALFHTSYGQLLLCKLFLFGLMLALAAVNRLREAPLLAGAPARSGKASEGSALARLKRNATLEAAAGVVIVAIVAVLGLTMPAAHMARHAQAMPTMNESHGR